MIGFWEQERETYEGWVFARWQQFQRETNADVLDRRRAARGQIPAVLHCEEFMQGWRGAWRLVRPFYSEEFVRWVEEDMRARRVTWNEWRRWTPRRPPEPPTEEFIGQVPALQQLRRYRDLAADFDLYMLQARDDGVPWTVIAEAAGMYKSTLLKRAEALKRGEGAHPPLLSLRRQRAPHAREPF